MQGKRQAPFRCCEFGQGLQRLTSIRDFVLCAKSDQFFNYGKCKLETPYLDIPVKRRVLVLQYTQEHNRRDVRCLRPRAVKPFGLIIIIKMPIYPPNGPVLMNARFVQFIGKTVSDDQTCITPTAPARSIIEQAARGIRISKDRRQCRRTPDKLITPRICRGYL
ncbi:hypothetical protein D3C81_565980 [compost metagenome]